MHLATYTALEHIERTHGERFIVEALRDAVQAKLLSHCRCHASEERIFERTAPWHDTKERLEALLTQLGERT